MPIDIILVVLALALALYSLIAQGNARSPIVWAVVLLAIALLAPPGLRIR